MRAGAGVGRGDRARRMVAPSWCCDGGAGGHAYDQFPSALTALYWRKIQARDSAAWCCDGGAGGHAYHPFT